jgi:hypothetical protein
MDVEGRFESLTAPELLTLTRYHELCTAIGGSTFFSHPIRLAVKASPEESYERVDHAGEDPLRSMAMWFRQLWMAKETTRFQAVLTILRRSVDSTHPDAPQIEAILDHLGTRHRHARRASLMKHVYADDPMGAPIRDFRAEQVIDDWLYGGAFHFDPRRRARALVVAPRLRVDADQGPARHLHRLLGARPSGQRAA